MQPLVRADRALDSTDGCLGAISLQVFQHLVSPLNDAGGHTCQFGHVDTEAMFATAACKFAQENDLTVSLAHGHVVVTNTVKEPFHLIEFVVMGGEEGLSMEAVLVDIFHYSPCYRDAIVGAGSATEFVKEHEGAFG